MHLKTQLYNIFEKVKKNKYNILKLLRLFLSTAAKSYTCVTSSLQTGIDVFCGRHSQVHPAAVEEKVEVRFVGGQKGVDLATPLYPPKNRTPPTGGEMLLTLAKGFLLSQIIGL
ncbi:hypothetical protein TNCV_3733711 [Trichonephila clavipes]|nr:hypothetical protein TNCV_3733711 [Trichonephila clavipes]